MQLDKVFTRSKNTANKEFMSCSWLKILFLVGPYEEDEQHCEVVGYGANDKCSFPPLTSMMALTQCPQVEKEKRPWRVALSHRQREFELFPAVNMMTALTKRPCQNGSSADGHLLPWSSADGCWGRWRGEEGRREARRPVLDVIRFVRSAGEDGGRERARARMHCSSKKSIADPMDVDSFGKGGKNQGDGKGAKGGKSQGAWNRCSSWLPNDVNSAN